MSDLARLAPPGSLEESLVHQLDLARIPRHVAIIMDGNGRWAKARHLPRVEGHRSGVEAVRDTVEAAAELGLEVLTLYAFSIENWKRPRYEIRTLMRLLKEYLRRELKTLVANDIRFRVLGRWHELDRSVVTELERGVAATAEARGMTLNIAVNYSGRCELVDACRRLVADLATGSASAIDEAALAARLDTAGQPDPDLLIRTSGELRVSNFLLWQIAYSELFVTPTLWPDFRRRELLAAILAFQSRERRFGGVSAEPADAAGPSLTPALPAAVATR